MRQQTKIRRPWIVLVSDLRRYLGRACDACTSNPARVLFFEARIGKGREGGRERGREGSREGRWLRLVPNEVTSAQLAAANAAFKAGKARRVCLADLPAVRRPTNRSALLLSTVSLQSPRVA